MNYWLHLTLTLSLTLTFNLYAESEGNEFTSSKLGHTNDGCPDNSNCTTELGIKRKNWVDAINNFSKTKSASFLNQFIQKEGSLLPVWILKEPTSNDTIWWNSPCKNHRVPNPKIYEGEIFAKELSKLKETMRADMAFLVLGENKIKTFLLPRNETPILIKDNALHFVRDEEGIFYNQIVHENGKIEYTTHIPKSTTPPDDAECPAWLIDKFKETDVYKKIYQGHFCKGIWNGTSYQTMIFGRGCF